MNIEQFLFTLPVMAKGMLGIFLVTGIIMLCIGLLNWLTGLKPKKNK
ncbi:MAG: hypothetical protein RRZ24_04400 [Clostridia bacterium]